MLVLYILLNENDFYLMELFYGMERFSQETN
ncbi:hypothetical protein FSU_1618 [Fibrobacter succinogenes subsp. succinogenes S85]|uniref:Uncharacterized protein n=1 Tax=Fibrobacter succinogenes (strain ATCC 19169 / S85) TaxID=59374 RepID=D9SAQ2_FIBSS|nr:hypothetical protein FSU_1618 [Fibrobacter succinogenes subsp. succinogenes S85]